MKKTIGIIGFGNMGSAIAERIKEKYTVIIFDKDRNKTKGLAGISVSDTIPGLVNAAELVILSVKPQDFDLVLDEMRCPLDKKIIVSIAAGIPIAYIENKLTGSRVIRVMPNIGVRIAQAESVLCKGSYADKNDLDFTRGLFDALGKTWVMPESKLDAVTAISGSGPAYVYFDLELRGIDQFNIPEEIKQEYIKRLATAAEKVGLGPEIATDLAFATVTTSSNLITITKVPIKILRTQITSKGGTTEAALEILAAGGSWEDAAVAAKKRAQDLSKRS